MSRSLHTQKLEHRATRRQARPYANRKHEGISLSGRGRPESFLPVAANHRLIHIRRPLPGMICPLDSHDVQQILERLGPVATYGLRSVRLHGSAMFTREGLLFGEYLLSGEIRLYAAPELPWRLPFLLAQEDQTALSRYGAQIAVDEQLPQTTVDWTVEGLKAFYLAEVLAHELGHHRFQVAHGKQTAIFCRRKDHERCADLYSARFGIRLKHSEGTN